MHSTQARNSLPSLESQDTEFLALSLSREACHTYQGLLRASACCTAGHIPSWFLLTLRLGLPELFRLVLNLCVTQTDLKLANAPALTS